MPPHPEPVCRQRLVLRRAQRPAGLQRRQVLLQLRPVIHADDSPESVTTLDSVLKDGLSSSQLKKYRGVFGGGQ